MNNSNSKKYTFYNGNFKFISSVVIKINQLLNTDIQIFGSYERETSSWELIQFSTKVYENNIRIEFERPLNYIQFKIEFIGDIPDDIEQHINFVVYKVSDLDTIRNNLKEKSITFVGCARSCVNSINNTLKIIEKMGVLFKSYNIAVFENDSNDGTDVLLNELQDKNILKLFQRNNLDLSMPLRTQRLSFARNMLLNYSIEENPDFICVLDFDGIITLEDNIEDSILSCFSYEECWDAVFPINAGIYYDIWAFRHKQLCPYDYEREMNTITPYFGDENIYSRYVINFQNLDFSKLQGWLNVDSAFGGVGIYRTEAFKNSNYSGFQDGYQICEHVNFHKKAAMSGAKLFINPKFVIGKKSIF